jgi:hypothetical protein
MPMSDSMMQSRHQPMAVSSSEPTPVAMIAPVPGTLWNQPAMPDSASMLPMPDRNGQGEAGTTWKGCDWFISRCTLPAALAMLRDWAVILHCSGSKCV